jgi:hypothetical protein
MRKLKLAGVLPIMQFVIAASLLQYGYRASVAHGTEFYVPTARLICLGLNAPAMLFMHLNPTSWGEAFDFLPRSVLGFDTDDLFFLLGVVVVWYFVGRAVDQRQFSRTAGKRRIMAPLTACPLLLALGGLLFHWGQQNLKNPYDNPDPPFGAVLMLAWAVSLIFFSGRWLVRTIRGMFVEDSARSHPSL